MKNPYPKESGFQKRMNYAKRALIRYGDDSSYDIFTRAFDECFENHDGEAVVFALMKAAKKERQEGRSQLHEGIQKYFGGRGPELWEEVFQNGQQALF